MNVAANEIEPDAGWGITELVIGFVALFIVSSIVGSAWLALSGEPNHGSITLGDLWAGLIGAWIPFFGTAFYCSYRRPGGFAGQLGLKFQFPNDLLKGVATGVLGQLLVSVIYLPVSLLDRKLADSVSNVAVRETASAHGWRWIPMILGIAVLAPFFEELFFRGVALRAISRKWGPIWGIFGSGVLFGLAHFEGIQTPALIVFGWVLGWRATKTGRIGETIFAHMTFNALTLVSLALS